LPKLGAQFGGNLNFISDACDCHSRDHLRDSLGHR
jgi:hypothetical protein